jgi:hypothetical protein
MQAGYGTVARDIMDGPLSIDLRDHRGGATSQDGENAILDTIFATIGTTDKVCVDCGAFDLEILSNVFPLWKDQGWTATLIEGNPLRALGMARRFRKMKAAGQATGWVGVVQRYAQADGPDSLDAILDQQRVPAVFDLVTIDIDGNDYEVWRGLVRHRPRVVVIEYNASIPAHVSLVGGPENYIGSSARALLELGRSKGYDLVAVTGPNLIFVDAALAGRFAPRNDLDALIDSSRVTYVVQTYDGAIVLAGGALRYGYNPFSPYVHRIERCSLPLRPLPSTPVELAHIWGRYVLGRSVREGVRTVFRAITPIVERALSVVGDQAPRPDRSPPG